VTDGPFARTRNPGYLGMALIYTGISLAANRRWPLIALPAVFALVDRGVVRREEADLTQRFGDGSSDDRGARPADAVGGAEGQRDQVLIGGISSRGFSTTQ
jgi:hypothetical protein